MQVPGLYVAPKNGPFDYVNCSLQGSRCEDVLWLVDGVRTANRLYNTTSPLDTIPTNMIERVEVLYGGQGIFYGTQSTAGVVNVVTKSFSHDPSGSIGIGFDDNDGTHVNGGLPSGFGDHQIVLFAGAGRIGRLPAVPRRGLSTERHGSRPQLREPDLRREVCVRLHRRVAPDARLSTHRQRARLRAALLGGGKQNERVDDWITAKWDYAPSDNVDLYVKAYWHDWDTNVLRALQRHRARAARSRARRRVNSDNLFWGFEDYGLTAVAEIRACRLVRVCRRLRLSALLGRGRGLADRRQNRDCAGRVRPDPHL